MIPKAVEDSLAPVSRLNVTELLPTIHPISTNEQNRPEEIQPAEVTGVKSASKVKSQPSRSPSKKTTRKKSQFFSKLSPQKRPRPPAGTVSCVEVPPLWDAKFGLIQEEFANSPFNLLVAVIFLNKTRGKYAIPVFRKLIEMYPTPQDFATADTSTLSFVIQPLGLQNQRAKKIINLAKSWISDPPAKGRRHRTLNYPYPGAAKRIKVGDILSDDDPRPGAWEVGHLPGLGPYAFDSWRIFCRDRLRSLADGWNGEGAGPMFEPEWKRVVPEDKELRAILRWMWLKEGWAWNPISGEKEVASKELMKRAEKGGLEWDGEADSSAGAILELNAKINDLGIIQSLPEDEPRILIRSSRNGGTRYDSQQLHNQQNAREDSESEGSEPENFGRSGSEPSHSEDSESEDSDRGSEKEDSEKESSDDEDSNEESDKGASDKETEVEKSRQGGGDTEMDEPPAILDMRRMSNFEENARKAKRLRSSDQTVSSKSKNVAQPDLESEDSEDEPLAKKRRTNVSRSGHKSPKLLEQRGDGQESDEDDQYESEEERPAKEHKTTTGGCKREHGKLPCTEPGCIRAFSTNKGRRRHIESFHNKQKFKCTVCDALLSRADKLKNHMRKIHPLDKEKLPCTECEQEFWTNDLLNRHVIVEHQGQKLYECTVCDKEFSRKDKFTAHLRTVRHAQNVLEKKKKQGGDGHLQGIYDDTLFEKNSDIEMESTGEGNESDEIVIDRHRSELYCSICEVHLSRKNKFNNHLKSAKHARNVSEQKRKANEIYDSEIFGEGTDSEMSSGGEEEGKSGQERNKLYKCSVCDLQLSREDKFKNHLQTAKHARNVLQQKSNNAGGEQLVGIDDDGE
jgi:methyl-CpG-binding domain protein 4